VIIAERKTRKNKAITKKRKDISVIDYVIQISEKRFYRRRNNTHTNDEVCQKRKNVLG
jgi:hypothetical protein